MAATQESVRELRRVRQIRQYEPKPVPEEIVHELLEIARWTGSSRNSQPWHFIVITDKELLRQISQLRPPIHWVADAPLAIAIVLDGENPHSEFFDEGRVTERLMIGAHLLGLGAGTAWYGDEHQRQQAKQLLGIPESRVARSVVTIGYTTTSSDPRAGGPPPGRKPLSELVSKNRYGETG